MTKSVLPKVSASTLIKMRNRCLLLASMLYLIGHATEYTFTPVGIHVGRNFAGHSFDFEPINYERGVVVNILMSADGIVAVDSGSSTITELNDDKGRSLMKSSAANTSVTFGAFPKVDSAGSAALFDIHCSEIPEEDSQFIIVKGTLAIKSATHKDKSLTKGVHLVKGTKLVWGEKQFMINEISKGEKLTLSLRTESDVSDFVDLRVVDATGKESIATCRAVNSLEVAGKRSTTLDCEIDADDGAFDVTITFWKDMRVSAVPFNVRAGVGLK